MTDPTRKRSAIRTWALVATAVTSAALIGALFWLIGILAAPDWCNRAVGATKYADGRPEFAVGGCFGLMMRQIDALAPLALVSVGVIAACLLTLVVIVLTGGRLSFKASREGVEADIGKDRNDVIRDGDDVTISKEP